MKYAQYTLTDLGYHVAALGGPGEIWGLDNMVVDDEDQRFWHLGVSGYPGGARALFERPDKSRCLAVFADGVTLPQGGTPVPTEDVPGLLMVDYGWPAGTLLVEGMPTQPERAL